MASPVLLSAQTTGTTLYLVFDRLITATNATGLTATVQPTGAANALTFGAVAGNTLRLTMASSLTAGQYLTVVLAGGTIFDQATGLSLATPFTATSVAAYSVPQTLSATAGLPTSNVIGVKFSAPVAATAGNLVAGFSVTLDGVGVVGSLTGSLSPDATTLSLALPANIPYTAVAVVTYASGSGQLYSQGTTATQIASFALTALNVSTTGLPNSSYPLSTIVKKAPTIQNGTVTAEIDLYLNPIDAKLVDEYGPATVSIGGTFGVTVGNPSGIYAQDSLVTLADGLVITQTFNSGTSPVNAVAAAKDWLTVIGSSISQALGAARALDQSVGPLTESLAQV